MIPLNGWSITKKWLNTYTYLENVHVKCAGFCNLPPLKSSLRFATTLSRLWLCPLIYLAEKKKKYKFLNNSVLGNSPIPNESCENTCALFFPNNFMHTPEKKRRIKDSISQIAHKNTLLVFDLFVFVLRTC